MRNEINLAPPRFSILYRNIIHKQLDKLTPLPPHSFFTTLTIMVAAFVVVPTFASANSQHSTTRSCSRRALLFSAGVAVGAFLSRDIAAANAIGLPKLSLPEIPMPSMPPKSSVETVKDVDTPLNIDTSSLEEKLLAKRKLKKINTESKK